MIMSHAWAILLSVALGFVAVYLLLPRPRSYSPWWGALLTVFALLVGGGICLITALIVARFRSDFDPHSLSLALHLAPADLPDLLFTGPHVLSHDLAAKPRVTP